MSVKQPDYVIRGGHLIDPSNNVNNFADVSIYNGKVLEVGQCLMKGQNEVRYLFWNQKQFHWPIEILIFLEISNIKIFVLSLFECRVIFEKQWKFPGNVSLSF